MRNVLLISIGICLLATASASAVPVDPNGPGGIAAVQTTEQDPLVMSTSGEVWRQCGDCTIQWERKANYDPPVPVASILDWGPFCILTVDGQIWTLASDLTTWRLAEPAPFQPVSGEKRSLGQVKGAYR